jgi:Tfp pilus assembly protein PilO
VNLLKEKKQIVICVIAVLLIVGFVLFSYRPLHRKIDSVNQAKNAQTLLIARSRSDSTRIPYVEEQLSVLESKYENYQIRIPFQTDNSKFIQQIAELMIQNNLNEQQITPAGEIQQGELSCIPVRIQCKGRLMDIFKFARELQNLNRQIRIETAVFENDSQYSGVVSMETEIVIYYRTDVAKG